MTYRNPGVSRVGRVALLAFGLVLASMSPIAPTAVAADDPKKISWRDDLAQAQAEAKSRDTLLWIQFSGPWCVNCRRMDRAAFADPGVLVEARERFVPVKLRSDEHEALAQSLGLTMLPSTVLVRPNGEVVDKWEGYAEPDEFRGFLATTLAAEGRSPEQVAARSRAKATKDQAVALAGYDPVTLLQDQKLVPGRADLVAEHGGRQFRFANETGRDAFLKQPESFAPANDGRCPVSQVDRGDFATGDPHWGVVYNGHLFLFRDMADRDRFAKDPERYAGIDRSARGSCPHCRERAPLARRLTSRFSTMFAAPTTTVASAARPGPAASPAGTPPSPSLADRLTSFLTLDAALRR